MAKIIAPTASSISRIFGVKVPEVTTTTTTNIAQTGDMVLVDREKNILVDPQGFGSFENFEEAVNAAGLELDWGYGDDLEGWPVRAIDPWGI